MGRKKAAMLYCFLEMVINQIEQYPLFIGLIFSRVVGGITTNLLFSVFESWLLTEHRRRNFAEEKLETIMRDSVIGSNLAAIVSGFLAHGLAEKYGSVGPFMGAVACTGFAFLLVSTAWSENYGCASEETTTLRSHMGEFGIFFTVTLSTCKSIFLSKQLLKLISVIIYFLQLVRIVLSLKIPKSRVLD